MKIVATGEQIGVREGRRIHGLYEVTQDDLAVGARFDDAICRVTFNIDVHSTDPTKTKGIAAAADQIATVRRAASCVDRQRRRRLC